jgi:hypothetical protein
MRSQAVRKQGVEVDLAREQRRQVHEEREA